MVGFLTAAILGAVVVTYSMVNVGKKGKRKAAPSHTKKGIPSAGTPNKFVVMHCITAYWNMRKGSQKAKKTRKVNWLSRQPSITTSCPGWGTTTSTTRGSQRRT